MLKGIHAGDAAFLVQLDRVESRIGNTNNQITSGIRVNQPQDDPFAIQPLLASQNQLDQLNQLQTNMNLAKNDAMNADSALQTTSNILNQLVSIASQSASDLTTPASRSNLAIQANQLAQQLVGIANTQVAGRYIFGGDDPTKVPYELDSTGAAAQVNTASATNLLQDLNGATQPAGMTAKDIFDDPSASIFQATYNLAQTLQTGDMAQVSDALARLKLGINHLATATVFYGNLEDWIQTASDQASSRMASLSQTIGSVRDTDLPTAITQMTSDQVALQAALSAHASLSTKTLFDYFG